MGILGLQLFSLVELHGGGILQQLYPLRYLGIDIAIDLQGILVYVIGCPKQAVDLPQGIPANDLGLLDIRGYFIEALQLVSILRATDRQCLLFIIREHCLNLFSLLPSGYDLGDQYRNAREHGGW